AQERAARGGGWKDGPHEPRQRPYREQQAVQRNRPALGARSRRAAAGPRRAHAQFRGTRLGFPEAPDGGGSPAGGGARARRQSLQGSRLEPQSLLRFLETVLSA